MYQISEELKNNGFSINSLKTIVERNSNKGKIQTDKHFGIIIAFESFTMKVNGKKISVEDKTVIFMGPHKDIEIEEEWEREVFLMAFSPRFFEQSAADSLLLNSSLFFNDKEDPFMAPFVAEKEVLRIFVVDRLTSFSQKKDSFYLVAAHHTLKAFMLDSLLFSEDSHVVNTEFKDRISSVNAFRVLLQKDYTEHKTVSYYAEKLSMTARKLTEITEQVTGKTAKRLIIEKIVSESSKLLVHGGLGVSEVSHKLGFANEGNFTNFIKKYTGKNPRDIKKTTDFLTLTIS